MKIIIALNLGGHAVINCYPATAKKFFNPEFVVNRTDQMKGTFSNRATLSPLQKRLGKRFWNH